MLALPLVLSALRTRPGKTAVSILGIALGVATAVGILTLDFVTVMHKAEKRADQYGRVDLEVIATDPAVPTSEQLKYLRSVDGVASASAIVQTAASLMTDGRPDGAARVVALDATARTSPAFDAYRIAEGADLPETDAPEMKCLVGAELARSASLKPGSRIALAAPARGGRGGVRCVDGRLESFETAEPASDPTPAQAVAFEVVGILAPYHLGKQGGGSVIVMPLSAVGRIGGERASAVYWLSKTQKKPIEQLKRSLTPAFAYSEERTALIGETADERAFRNGVRVSGVLALLLGLFVIFHTLSMSLIERVREIAALAALGADRAQIGRAFFLEGFIVSALGASAGIGIGVGMARVALLAGYTTLGRIESIGDFGVPWTPVLAVGGLGLLIAQLGSIFPLVKARSIHPARVLSQRDLGRDTDLFKGLNIFMFVLLAVVMPALYFFAVPLLGETSQELGRVVATGGLLFVSFLAFLMLAPRVLAMVCRALAAPLERSGSVAGFLASRSMADGTARVAISAAMVGMVAAALLTIHGITQSLQAEVRSWGAGVATKVFVSATPPIPRARVEKLRSLPGAAGIESLGNWIDAPFLIRGLRSQEAGFTGPFRDPEVLKNFDESESLILSTPLSRALHIAPGSEIAVGVPDGPPRKLKVIAVSDGVGYFPTRREFGVVPEKWLRKHFCLSSDDGLSQFALRFADGVDPAAAAAAVKTELADLPPAKIRSGADVRDYELEDIDRDFRLFDWILGLVALLAGVGVLNALLLAALERRKEIGVMKALGMIAPQLAKTVLVEAGIIGFIGGGLGCALGSGFNWIAVDALARLTGLSLTFELRPAWILFAWGGSVLLSLAAAFVPIARSNRFSAAEAVRYE